MSTPDKANIRAVVNPAGDAGLSVIQSDASKLLTTTIISGTPAILNSTGTLKSIQSSYSLAKNETRLLFTIAEKGVILQASLFSDQTVPSWSGGWSLRIVQDGGTPIQFTMAQLRDFGCIVPMQGQIFLTKGDTTYGDTSLNILSGITFNQSFAITAINDNYSIRVLYWMVIYGSL